MAPKKKAPAKKAAPHKAVEPTPVEAVAASPSKAAASPSTASPAKVATPGKAASAKKPVASTAASASPKSAVPAPADDAKATAAAAATADAEQKPRAKKVRVRQALDVVLADNPNPAAMSVVASCLSADESRLVTARSNGSIAIHRVLIHKRSHGASSFKRRGRDAEGVAAAKAKAEAAPARKIFNFILTATTGGRADAVPTAVLFLGAKDEYVVAAYGSGAFVVFDATALSPLCHGNRVGGVARSLARSGKNDFFAAVSDGSARRWQLIKVGSSGEHELRMVQTVPKAVGCERALAVAVSKELGLVIVADDSRAVTAWDLRPVEDIRATTQRWSLQLANSFPLALAVHGHAIAVGTSMNEVVFVDPSAGIIANTFEHHKGPVTVVTAAAGVFYASGWHDSIRAYRANPDEGESAAQRGRRRERDAINNTTAASRVGAGDYAPAEVKRRTHYHEVSSICVGVKTGLFVSTARDGTILFANLERFFTSPASYIDSQVSAKPHTLAGGDLLFTHRDNTVEVHRVLPHALAPLISYALEGDSNVRGLWVNGAGTRACVATDERVSVLSIDVDRDMNSVSVQRLVSAAIPAVAAACFSDEDTALVASGPAMLVIRCDPKSVAANTKAGRLGFGKASQKLRGKQQRLADAKGDEALAPAALDRVEAAASLSAVTQCFTHADVEGTIVAAIAPSDGANSHIFIATQQPAAVHWLALAKDRAGAISGVGFSEKLDSISHAPLKGKEAASVTFLNVADERHYISVTPGTSGRKIIPVTTAETPLPLTTTIHGRSTTLHVPGAVPNAPFVCSFQNGLIDIRSSGDRWRYTRPADREKAAPNDIKARVEFAAFAPQASPAPWASGSAEVVKELDALRKRAKKAHRTERATIALDGEASDADGSDDEAVLEAHIDQRKAAEARGESGAVDAAFALRRNVPALVQGLPLAWRVRRFGN